MEIIEKYLNHSDMQELLPVLLGNVFHVTPWSTIPRILEDEFLRCNQKDFEKPLADIPNCYFRKRNCISFFDYRNYKTKEWKNHYTKCYPIQILDIDTSIAILFLKSIYYESLISWEQWKKEKAFHDRIVPFIETGYPEKLSINAFEYCLHVSLNNVPPT